MANEQQQVSVDTFVLNIKRNFEQSISQLHDFIVSQGKKIEEQAKEIETLKKDPA